MTIKDRYELLKKKVLKRKDEFAAFIAMLETETS